MGTTDKGRLDDLKDTINGIDNRLVKVEEKVGKTREEALINNAQLKELITEAVSKGNEKSCVLIDEIEKRVCTIENAEANRALQNKKNTLSLIKTAVITTILGSVSLGIFTNGVSIISEAIKSSSEKGVEYEEVSEINSQGSII